MKNLETDFKLVKKIVKNKYVVVGYWIKDKIVGSFILIQTNGNTFIGEQYNSVLKGVYYKYNEIIKIFTTSNSPLTDLFKKEKTN
jgi:hypothetical protein